MSSLSRQELKILYRILRVIDEDLLSYPEEEWELDHYDDRLVERKGIKPLLKKIKTMLPKEDTEEIDRWLLMRKYGGFSRGVDERVYSALERAFRNTKRVSVEYFSPSSEEVTRRDIDIYYLSRKYVIALCHLRKEIRQFRADRFIKAKLTDKEYRIPKDFDKSDYV